MNGLDKKVYFVGSFHYALDGKDRLNIPFKFRRILPEEAKDSFVITKGFENCLHLYPSNYWYEFIYRYWELFYSNQIDYRKFAIWVYRDTFESQLDKQGRIAIPKILLTYAHLTKEVLIIGYNTRIELWNPDDCHNFVGTDDQKYMKMAVDFTSQIPFRPPQFANFPHSAPDPPPNSPYPPPSSPLRGFQCPYYPAPPTGRCPYEPNSGSDFNRNQYPHPDPPVNPNPTPPETKPGFPPTAPDSEKK